MALRRPINSDYTQAVADQGLAAVNQRRRGSQFDPTNYGQALTYLAQTGYGPSMSANLYNQWMQSRGFNPTGYNVTVGQSPKGKYGGFSTLGMLQAAIRGQAETMRHQDRQQADELAALANKYLDQAQGMYADEFKTVADATARDLPQGTYRAQAFSAAANNAIGDAQNAHGGAELNKWLGETTDPYLSALELASQIGQTPIRNYATVAGANYGVDPNIVAGWYPDASTITDYRNQRDLQSLQNYGMTQSEYEQWLNGQNRNQTDAANAAADQQDQQYLDYIYGTTGLDGKQLASAVDMTVPQLASAMNSENFQNAYATVMDTLNNNNGNDIAATQQAVANDLAPYMNDPTMYSLLTYLFSQYLP